jgi:hypothetical protein
MVNLALLELGPDAISHFGHILRTRARRLRPRHSLAGVRFRVHAIRRVSSAAR